MGPMSVSRPESASRITHKKLLILAAFQSQAVLSPLVSETASAPPVMNIRVLPITAHE
jgi:hypothetical protein